jgi:hypothetical protein
VYRFNKGDVMATYNSVAHRITGAVARPAGAKKKPGAEQKEGHASLRRAAKPKAKKKTESEVKKNE